MSGSSLKERPSGSIISPKDALNLSAGMFPTCLRIHCGQMCSLEWLTRPGSQRRPQKMHSVVDASDRQYDWAGEHRSWITGYLVGCMEEAPAAESRLCRG
jgi:hypothetical protein